MKEKYFIPILTSFLISLLAITSCQNKGDGSGSQKPESPISNPQSAAIQIPDFQADSAYAFIEAQLAFGPRVPNTTAHQQCATWLEEKFRSYGAEVIVQRAKLKAWDGTELDAANIIAQFQPEKANRILLMAHWDSRPYADHDPDENLRNNPIPGANDGASGVGVLLEIGRQLQKSNPLMGVDLILFDAEDYGVPDHLEAEWEADTWCLGSQYWSKNPHVKDYYARFGILLDMVGAPNAIFTQEEVSLYYAKSVVDKVWKKARELGYSSYFSTEKTPQIVDDHRYVNEIIGIPSLDIIQYDHNTESHFSAFWHTHQDDIQNISKETLKAVGEVLLHVIFTEK